MMIQVTFFDISFEKDPHLNAVENILPFFASLEFWKGKGRYEIDQRYSGKYNQT